jgi:hypothetical protein
MVLNEANNSRILGARLLDKCRKVTLRTKDLEAIELTRLKSFGFVRKVPSAAASREDKFKVWSSEGPGHLVIRGSV